MQLFKMDLQIVIIGELFEAVLTFVVLDAHVRLEVPD